MPQLSLRLQPRRDSNDPSELCGGSVRLRKPGYAATRAVAQADLPASCLPTLSFRQSKADAPCAILYLRGLQIEVGERNLRRNPFLQSPKRLADDCVILNLHSTAIAKHKNCRNRWGLGCGLSWW